MAMTNEEKNARRRELDRDPFHRALTYKTARAWRQRNRDKLNARRREKYRTDAEYRAAERARQLKYNTAHPEARAKAWKKWADKNRDALHASYAARYHTPEGRAKCYAKNASRMARIRADPELHDEWKRRKRATEAARYARLMRDPVKWTAWRMEHWWLPRWTVIVPQGPEAIARYLRRARPDARKAFIAWYTRQNLLDTRSGLGQVRTVFDEDVPETRLNPKKRRRKKV